MRKKRCLMTLSSYLTWCYVHVRKAVEIKYFGGSGSENATELPSGKQWKRKHLLFSVFCTTAKKVMDKTLERQRQSKQYI